MGWHWFSMCRRPLGPKVSRHMMGCDHTATCGIFDDYGKPMPGRQAHIDTYYITESDYMLK
jgi:hypothetical protein